MWVKVQTVCPPHQDNVIHFNDHPNTHLYALCGFVHPDESQSAVREIWWNMWSFLHTVIFRALEFWRPKTAHSHSATATIHTSIQPVRAVQYDFVPDLQDQSLKVLELYFGKESVGIAVNTLFIENCDANMSPDI